MTARLDVAAMRVHYDALFGSADRDYLALWHLPSRLTTWVNAGDVAAVIAALIRQGDGGNSYNGIGLHPAPLGEHSRGTADGVCAIPGLWLDLDIAGPGHKATNRPPDADAAWQLIHAAVPLPPSYVVGSGGGLHCYWLLHEPWTFDNDGERQHAGRLVRMLQWLVVREARKHGWLVDSLGDLSRVLRFAGTINRKNDVPERPVTVLQNVRRRYSIEELERVLPLDDPAFAHVRERTPTAGGPSQRGPSRTPAALWSRISAQCAYLSHCEHDAATLSEPEWHAAMTIIGRCHNGKAISRQVSSPYPGYSVDETQSKFSHALVRDTPMRCSTIRYERGGEPWCSGCPFWGRISSPIQLGYAPGYHHQPAAEAEQETAS
jgi:hypothetical protein